MLNDREMQGIEQAMLRMLHEVGILIECPDAAAMMKRHGYRLADLGLTKSHSRPHVSNDNPSPSRYRHSYAGHRFYLQRRRRPPTLNSNGKCLKTIDTHRFVLTVPAAGNMWRGIRGRELFGREP